MSVTNLTLTESCLIDGSTVSIHCGVKGFPRPIIEFLKNDIVITPGQGQFENFMWEFYNQVLLNQYPFIGLRMLK